MINKKTHLLQIDYFNYSCKFNFHNDFTSSQLTEIRFAEPLFVPRHVHTYIHIYIDILLS